MTTKTEIIANRNGKTQREFLQSINNCIHQEKPVNSVVIIKGKEKNYEISVNTQGDSLNLSLKNYLPVPAHMIIGYNVRRIN